MGRVHIFIRRYIYAHGRMSVTLAPEYLSGCHRNRRGIYRDFYIRTTDAPDRPTAAAGVYG